MRWRSVGPARGGRSIDVGGSDAASERVLVRRHRRRRLEDHRRRQQLGGDDRRQDRHVRRSDRSRCASPTPTWSTSAAARRSSAATSSRATGIYKTTDGGKTWTHLPQLRDSQAIARIRLHPTNCDIVYAAVFGQVYNDHPERGVFKSTDGGQTFKKTLYRDEKTPAIDLSIDPTNPNVMFAGPLGSESAARGACRVAVPAAACSSPPTAATPGPRSRRTRACPSGLWGKVGVVGVAGGRQPRLRADRERKRRPLRLRRCAARPGS